MDFQVFKINIIEVTSLAKDALHIYVGVGLYLICLLILRPIFRGQGVRTFMALIVVTSIALLGEYLDNQNTIDALGITGLSRGQLTGSIRDLINTCLLPYIIFALNKWTSIFHPTVLPSQSLRKRP